MLSWTVLAQGVLRDCSQLSAWATGIPRLNLGWRIHIQGHSCDCLQASFPPWLLAGGFSFLPLGPLHWADQLSALWEGITQRRENQEVGSLGTILEMSYW